VRIALLLIAAGCNQVYGLEQTRVRDAPVKEFFDAPVDAMPGCGGGEPLFQPQYFQLPIQENCFSYSTSEAGKIAVARCNLGVRQGKFDDALDTETFPPNDPIDEPRLSPEGDVLFVEASVGTAIEVQLYRRTGETWTLDRKIADGASYRYISNPTRAPNRRAIQTDFQNNVTKLVELVEQPGTWMEFDRYPITDLGLSNATSLSLTPDGLHLTVASSTLVGSAVFFASRPDVSQRFGLAVLLTTVPKEAQSPFMTDNCARIYFTALTTVFYQKLR
jgi:hypothetical protein